MAMARIVTSISLIAETSGDDRFNYLNMDQPKKTTWLIHVNEKTYGKWWKVDSHKKKVSCVFKQTQILHAYQKISPCEWHKSYSTSAAFSFVSAAAAAPARRCMPRMLGGSCWSVFGRRSLHMSPREFGNVWTVPSGKRLQITMERSTIFHGKIKIHYLNGHFQ